MLNRSQSSRSLYTDYAETTVSVLSTPWEVLPTLMDLLMVGEHDVLYDLGCGDGRVVIEAAKRGARAVCIEINKVLCNVVEVASRYAEVSERVQVVCRDIFDVNLSKAEPSPTIVYLYHYLSTLERLAIKLSRELSIGTVVVSLDTPIPSWRAIKVVPIIDSLDNTWFLWVYIMGYE